MATTEAKPVKPIAGSASDVRADRKVSYDGSRARNNTTRGPRRAP
jgi:hypothetical protein